MKERFPPLKSLHAFEVAARHQSFIEAAEELAVTPGAISRHVKILEDFLQTTLFERRSSGVVLTRQGKRYAERTSLAFRDLASATAEIKKRREARSVVISTLPTFAERWLYPRFPSFQSKNVEVAFKLDIHERTSLDWREGVDACVYYSTRRHLTGDVTFLFSEELYPVCSPALFRKLPANVTVDQIARLPRLHDVHWDNDWRDWARGVGAAHADFSQGVSLALYSGVIQAACSGMGIAIGHAALIGDELADGRLIALRQFAVRSANAFYLVMPQVSATRPFMRTFKEWIQTEAKLDERVIHEER